MPVKGVEHCLLGRREVRCPVGLGAAEAPLRCHRGGKHPVLGLRESGEGVGRESPELRVGRVEDDQVLEPADDRRARGLVVDDDSGPDQAAVARERVRTADPAPGVLLDCHAGARDRLLAGDEVARQLQGQRLGLDCAQACGEGVHRVLLGVRRQHLGVVAGEVAVGEVARQAARDIPVAHDVTAIGRRTTGHPHDPDLGLAVAVAPEHRHQPTPLASEQTLAAPR